MKAVRRRLFCHGPKPEFELDDDWADRFYIPARAIPLLCPGSDVVILPGGSEEVRQFWNFCASVLGFEESQAIWTSGRSYLIDDDIESELLPELALRMESDRWEIVPYADTVPFARWARTLPANVFGDSPELSQRFNKSTLHPKPGEGTVSGAVRRLGLRVPKGFSCDAATDLVHAATLMERMGIPRFLVKPVWGAAGEGIRELDMSGLSSYAFPMGPVVLEERLDIDADEGAILAPSVQFNGTHLIGAMVDQVLEGMAFAGNRSPSRTSREFQEDATGMARRILRFLRPHGPGGFDFLSVGGKPILVDPNIGRFTGAHPAKMFVERHVRRKSPHSWKTWKITPTIDTWTLWARLSAKGIALDPKGPDTNGVFPLAWLPGMWGMLIAIADDEVKLSSLQEETLSIL